MVDLNEFCLVKQGAEARLYTGNFLGQQVVVKERFSKKYRLPELDVTLTKERHKAECRALLKCKSLGVPVPTMFLCDNKENIIVMQNLATSQTARDCINKLLNKNCDQPDKNSQEELKFSLDDLASSIGSLVAKLHNGGLIHGDITTSNIMVEPQGKLFFIDFGLSFQEGVAEDKGVDLYVLERALVSTHPNTEFVFQRILESYTKAAGAQGPEVLKKFEEIRQRGRKRTMLG